MQNSLAKKVFAVGIAASTVLMALAPLAAQAAAHAAGTNVLSSDGTIWMVTSNGQRRAYTSAGAFLSYGFNSFASTVTANADDLALPAGSFIPPQDGSLTCSDRGSDKGTCYLVTGGMKAGFTSAAVFTGRGFSFSNSKMADSSWMTSTANINDTTSSNLPGVLVNNNGTVQLMGTTGLLGIPDLATFNSWGYSFKNVVPANAADKAMSQTGVMAARVAGQLSPSFTAAPPCTSNCPPPPPPPPPVGGALSASLASDTAVAASIPTSTSSGAAFIPFTAINFTAGSNAATVTQLKVHRLGLGSDSNLNNLYLFSGNMMLAQTSSFQSGVAIFSASNGLFTVGANSTLEITIKGDLASNIGSGLTYGFGLTGASDVVSNASSVSGSFPVNGNLMTTASVSNPALATLTAVAVAVGTSVNAGTMNNLSGQFTLQAANSTVKVTGVTLTVVGSVNAANDLKNVILKANGAPQGSPLASLPSNGIAFFDLSANPLMVSTGQTVTMQIFADVMGTPNRSFTFSVQHNYDIVAYDTTYNTGVLTSGTFALNNGSGSGTAISVLAGSLTMNRDASSRTGNVAISATNVKLATFAFKANGEDVKVLTLPFSIALTSGSGNLVLANIKLVDNQGYGIGTSDTTGLTVTQGALGVAAAYVAGPSGTTNLDFTTSSTLNYVIPANTTRLVSIVADILSTSTATGTVQAGFHAAGTAQGVVSVSSLTLGTVSGNGLTLSTTLLSSVVSSGLASPVKVVPNAPGAKVASFSLSSGGADGVNITTIQLTGAAASLAANFQNLKVMVGSQQIGITQTTLSNSSTVYSFSAGTPIQIPSGGSIIVDVYADVLSGAETTVSQALVSLSGITAQLASSGSAVASANISGLSTTGQTVNVVGNGAVTISSDNTAPSARQVAMGQTGVVLGVLRFQETSNNEAINLTDLTVTATSLAGTPLNGTASTSANTLKNFTVTDGTTTVSKGSWTTAAASGAGTLTSTVTFNNLGFVVPANGTLLLTFKADINSWTSGGASGAQFKVGIAATSTDVTLRGASSNSTINAGLTSNALSPSTTVVRSTVAAAAVSSGGGVSVSPVGITSTAENMGIFTFTASNSDDVQINSINIQQGGSAPSTTANTTYTVYNVSQNPVGSNSVGTGIILAAGSSTTVTFSTPIQVTKGSTVILALQANTSNFNVTSGNAVKTYILNLTGWNFSDGISSPFTAFGQSGSATLPVTAVTTGAARTY